MNRIIDQYTSFLDRKVGNLRHQRLHLETQRARDATCQGWMHTHIFQPLLKHATHLLRSVVIRTHHHKDAHQLKSGLNACIHQRSLGLVANVGDLGQFTRNVLANPRSHGSRRRNRHVK